MICAHQQLFERCRAIVRQTKISGAFDEIIIMIGPGTNERAYGCIEHTFHELGHAALLRLPFGTRSLSDAITVLLDEREDAGRNEVETFAVVSLLCDHFGIEYDRRDLLHGIEVQYRRIDTTAFDEARLDPRVVDAAARVREALSSGFEAVSAPLRKIEEHHDDGLLLSCGHIFHSERVKHGAKRARCFRCLAEAETLNGCGFKGANDTEQQ